MMHLDGESEYCLPMPPSTIKMIWDIRAAFTAFLKVCVRHLQSYFLSDGEHLVEHWCQFLVN